MTDAPTTRERVGFSPARVWIIATNTLTESVRQKVFNILLVFALVVIAFALFFRQYDFGAGEEFKFVKDFCLGAISVFGTCIAIVGTSMLLPNEVEHRTIYTILSKPVRRLEFLLGKFLGSVELLLTSTILMSIMFGVVLFVMMFVSENRVRQEVAQTKEEAAQVELQQQFVQIRADTFDPNIVKGVLLIFVELCLVAGVTLLVSTFSTSMVFNVIVAAMIFIAGHLVGPAKDAWSHVAVVDWVLAIIPDLSSFNVADDIVLGNAIPWEHVGSVALYGVVYTAAVVAAAHFIFEGREI
jgi:ABC-type transport system involved in multi-copper enzyme maturation permease subunit